ncbi:cupin domain-containing protein [Subsaxibacter sp. CAU 1640]|uniref:cupin domain-containing protein n=1 Tax=Subsaxibacter sp. CAU 1640 TaxID=2933271 RepID=UPI002003EE0D|nr:cupin domain-containing protein [Subsaxibacter sp. CAU 1640]MCK7591555.1 cupin domain-containing protein [Subsaxibacter sp. CAU 1640]
MFVNCNGKQSSIENLPDPFEAGWEGQQVSEIIEDNSQMRILKCTFPPGVGHEKHYHKPHTGYTLSGSTFRITDENGTREVNVPIGYTFSNDELSVHEVLNVGDSTAVFLIIEPK